MLHCVSIQTFLASTSLAPTNGSFHSSAYFYPQYGQSHTKTSVDVIRYPFEQNWIRSFFVFHFVFFLFQQQFPAITISVERSHLHLWLICLCWSTTLPWISTTATTKSVLRFSYAFWRISQSVSKIVVKVTAYRATLDPLPSIRQVIFGFAIVSTSLKNRQSEVLSTRWSSLLVFTWDLYFT